MSFSLKTLSNLQSGIELSPAVSIPIMLELQNRIQKGLMCSSDSRLES